MSYQPSTRDELITALCDLLQTVQLNVEIMRRRGVSESELDALERAVQRGSVTVQRFRTAVEPSRSNVGADMKIFLQELDS